MSQTKTCTKCGVTKTVSGFARRSASSDLLQSRCKECQSKSTRKPRDKDERRRANAKYRAKHKEAIALYAQQYRQRNREILSEKLRNWRALDHRNRNQQTIDLTDGYVARRVFRNKGVSVLDVPKELIEMMRSKLQIHRATKQLLSVIKEKQK